MGSFSVSCSISKISIDYGDPIVLLPLNKNIFCQGFDQRLLVAHGYGPSYAYEAATLPLFGTYNDYGYIQVEEDENTKAIEKYTGLTIDYFANTFEVMKVESSAFFDAAMYIHRPLYDFLSKARPRISTKFVRNQLLTGDVGLDEYIGGLKKLSRDVTMFAFKRVIEELMGRHLISDQECERLVGLYGFTSKMSENLIQMFTDFAGFLRGCVAINAVFMPWAQHTQHGEITDQLTLHKECVKLLEVKDVEYRAMMEDDEDYDDEEY